MRLDEKLRKHMQLKGLNQQMLARVSGVSDSEVSRILTGKSNNPGLENALRLARAVGVSLDYLADDSIDDEAAPSGNSPCPPLGSLTGGTEDEILAAARQIGVRQARRVLETACDLGYEIAIRRLLELRPTDASGATPGDPTQSSSQGRRASSI